jgi:DNA polymerase-3 subunit epsilon
MRQIVLDTETTGLEASQGHRIIEIGCVEIVNRRITERRYQQYINPERDIDAGAVEVHGITLADLAERPTFADIAMEFVEFVRGAELVIHNASFDVGFLNMELERLGPAWGRTEDYCTVFDTLPLAREMHPGQRNSLDALCKRYDVSNAHRERHGALLDAELLAEVYLAMTGGQATLALDAGRRQERHTGAQARPLQRPSSLVVVMPNAEELAAHELALKAVDKASRGQCVWMKS